ncbi:MAG: putative metal-binding motif-containing protein [Candidatus Woesearchaeota archaeon]
MKRGITLIFALFLLLLSSALIVYSQTGSCTWQPECTVKVQSCGCGGTQTRATLCNGGCGEWYACSKPDKETICTDNQDNDCDGMIDCSDPDCGTSTVCDTSTSYTAPPTAECTEGAVQECGEGGLGVCSKGERSCLNGQWGVCTMHLPSTEICDGLDNDCDGETDEGCDATVPAIACINGSIRGCGIDIGACKKGTQVCISGVWGACEGGVRPIQEQCGNNEDDNCDGRVDESCNISRSGTVDTGVPQNDSAQPALSPRQQILLRQQQQAEGAAPQGTAPTTTVAGRECIDGDGDGYGQFCQKSFDCNDNDASIHPDAEEICNNIDEDCNNQIDDHLSRDCGSLNIGACSTGKEQCREGRWVGCTAKGPNPERCGNSIDDDCDGEVDEDCKEKPVSVSRQALIRALDARFGEGKYNETDIVKKQQNTNRFVNMNKRSAIANGRTQIRIKVTPVQGLKNFTIYEEIPKSIAQSAKDIIFSIQPEILEDDPLVAWHFSELTQATEITYEVAGEHEDAAEQTSTTTIAEETEALEQSWFVTLLPLMIIPILGLAFVFLVQMTHRKE